MTTGGPAAGGVTAGKLGAGNFKLLVRKKNLENKDFEGKLTPRI